jgi:hypothetical protein
LFFNFSNVCLPFAALALGGEGGVKERSCGCKGQGCCLLPFCHISLSHPFFFFNCFVLLTSVQAKYERDLEIVVKEKETERDIEMKKVSPLPLILYLTHMITPTPIHIR